MMRSISTVRVRYADTDQMRFVYNGKYFEYFEVGRTELLRDCGLTYRMVEEQGYYMPVRETKITYKNAALYDELLEIETFIPELPTAIVHIEYSIRVPERNILVCTGYVDLMFVKASTGKACRAPEFFLNAVRHLYA